MLASNSLIEGEWLKSKRMIKPAVKKKLKLRGKFLSVQLQFAVQQRWFQEKTQLCRGNTRFERLTKPWQSDFA